MSSLVRHADRDSTASDALHAASTLALAPSIDRALEAVRDLLGMEIAYATQHRGETQHLRVVVGDTADFGMSGVRELPLAETYCQRVLEGRLPNLNHDVRGDERSASLAVTEATGIGAFCSVPVRLSDGRLYGTLCAASQAEHSPFTMRDLEFMHVFARIIADQFERDELQAQANRLELEAAVAAALLAAVASRDAYTSTHSRAVVERALAVAAQLGLDADETHEVRMVALLHDIGKLAIPDAILQKPGALSAEERCIMRTHPIESERIVALLPGLAHLARPIRSEHENFDGTGYPDGLAGEAIPLVSRITLVCDAYDAMISDRPYRAALTHETARAQIVEATGSQFCPRAAAALLAIIA